MAAVTSAVIGVGLSAYQTVDAINQKNEAQDAIDNFKPQDLRNPNKDIQLDTNRADRLTRANQVNTASSIDALQRTGTRGVLAGVPKINSQSILLQNLIEEDLSKQARERDILIARGEERIQNIQEKREQDTLLGLGQQLNVANQNIVNGVTGAVQSGLAIASATRGSNNNNSQPPRERVSTASSLTPAGVSSRGSVSTASSLTPVGVSTSGTNPLTLGVNDFNLIGV